MNELEITKSETMYEKKVKVLLEQYEKDHDYPKLKNELLLLVNSTYSLPNHIEAGIQAKRYGYEMNKSSENPNGFHEIDFYNGTVWLRERIEENLLELQNGKPNTPIVTKSIFDQAVKHVQETYCNAHLSYPYMLLGDVSGLIKILTGIDVDVNVLAKFSKKQ